MTTFISDQQIAHLQTSPSALEYVTLTGNVSRSGNTVTLSGLNVNVRVTYVYSVYGETQTYYIAESASSTTQLSTTGSFGFDFNDGPNHTQDQSMTDMSFSVGTADTSKTLYLRAVGNEDNQIAFTVTFPAGTVVAPDTPTISLVSATDSSITLSYGTTSFGTPSTGTVYLPCVYDLIPSAFADTFSVASKTSTGLSNATIARYYRPPLSYVMQNNSRYYVAAYAKNDGGATARSNILAVVTCASAPTVSLDSVTNTSATIAYTTVAGGGVYAQDIQYSIDGGTTWVTADTVASGTTTATSGTYTITGLTSGTTYSIQTRVSTTAGTTTGSTLSATTSSSATTLSDLTVTPSTTAVTFTGVINPGSSDSGTATITVNGVAQSITYDSTQAGVDQNFTNTFSGLTEGTTYPYTITSDAGTITGTFTTSVALHPALYGSIPKQASTVTGTIRSGGIGNVTAFDGETFLEATNYSPDNLNYIAVTLNISKAGTYTVSCTVYFTSGSASILVNNVEELADYGITATATSSGTDYIDLTATTVEKYISEKVEKLYGSIVVDFSSTIRPVSNMVTSVIDSTLFSALKPYFYLGKEPAYVTCTSTTTRNYYRVSLTYTDGTSQRLENSIYGPYLANQYGINCLNVSVAGFFDYIDLSYSRVSKEIIKVYGPTPHEVVTGVTGTVRSGGTGNITAFDGETFFDKSSGDYDLSSATYLKITTSNVTKEPYSIYLHVNGSEIALVTAQTSATLLTYGVTVPTSPTTMGTDYIDLTLTTGTEFVSKLIYEGAL